jgi:hypothetical protein
VPAVEKLEDSTTKEGSVDRGGSHLIIMTRKMKTDPVT